MLEDIKKDAIERMQKCVAALQERAEEAAHRPRAHRACSSTSASSTTATKCRCNQVANIALEDARTLTVTPWEKTMVQVIEKAIMKSDLGLMPNTAGTVIRVPMPPLTEERRRDLTKVVRHEAENARVAVRNVRRDVMNELKEMLKEKLMSQDDDRRAQDEVQKLTDKHVAEIDQVLAEKEKELMQV